ncbi:hypothetical protein FOA52_007322 [Chlamydomonas sp. UWO 241]|nr:hypothetical protein FOA52_007322 [Chlamydomonas sp. UWO 241]
MASVTERVASCTKEELPELKRGSTAQAFRYHDLKPDAKELRGLEHLTELRALKVDGGWRRWTTLELVDAGIDCGYDKADPRVLSSTTVLRVAKNCPRLEELVLDGLPLVDNACMQAVGQMPDLKILRLGWADTGINRRGIEAMGVCPGLRELVLYADGAIRSETECWVDHKAFECIADQFPNLTCLRRHLCCLGRGTLNAFNDGFKHLQRLKSLTHLALRCTSVNDSGLAHIAKIESLQSLDLSCNSLNPERPLYITPAGMRHVAKLPRLLDLDLGQWSYFSSDFLDAFVVRCTEGGFTLSRLLLEHSLTNLHTRYKMGGHKPADTANLLALMAAGVIIEGSTDQVKWLKRLAELDGNMDYSDEEVVRNVRARVMFPGFAEQFS